MLAGARLPGTTRALAATWPERQASQAFHPQAHVSKEKSFCSLCLQSRSKLWLSTDFDPIPGGLAVPF